MGTGRAPRAKQPLGTGWLPLALALDIPYQLNTHPPSHPLPLPEPLDLSSPTSLTMANRLKGEDSFQAGLIDSKLPSGVDVQPRHIHAPCIHTCLTYLVSPLLGVYGSCCAPCATVSAYILACTMSSFLILSCFSSPLSPHRRTWPVGPAKAGSWRWLAAVCFLAARLPGTLKSP